MPTPLRRAYSRASGNGTPLDMSVRKKLAQLSEDSGGKVFHVAKAEELAGVYEQIEAELRSQYLLAYTSDRPGGGGEYRKVEVKVKGGKLKARTTRGYYP